LHTDGGGITVPRRLMTLLREFTDSETALVVPHHAPRIFYVNWFHEDDSGRFLRRCDGEADAEDSAICRVPAPEPRLSCG
jgi:hypothetical protein